MTRITSAARTPFALTALAVAICTAGPVSVAHADSSGSAASALEEVVVTARRREESMQSVPIAVTALSEEFLRQQNITELNDLGTQVPSFRVSTAGVTPNEPVLALRGQRPTDARIWLDPAVQVYMADVVISPSTGSNLAMYDLQNVQVLKGPQGTLFGRNSTGGALLLTPAKPGDEFGGFVDVKLGNYNLVHTEAAVDLPVSDSLKFRLAGRKLERDGYQDNVADNALRGKNKYWDEDSQGLRLTTDWQVTENLNNTLLLSYDENDMGALIPAARAFAPSIGLGQLVNPFFNRTGAIDDALARQAARDPFRIETDMDARETIENTFAANTTEWQINDNLTVKNIVGYRKMKMDRSEDVDGTALPLFGSLTSFTGNVTLNPEGVETNSEQFSNEIQLMGDSADGALEWIVGAYWYQMKGSIGDTITQTLGANPAGTPLYAPKAGPSGDIENTAKGLFAEGTYSFNDSWSLTAGIRQSWDERQVTLKNVGTAQNAVVGPLIPVSMSPMCDMTDEQGNFLPENGCAREISEKYDSPTWRLSLNHTTDAGSLVYGSIATGYRAGGFNMRGTTNAELKPFDEETVITYELGYKADWQLGDSTSLRTNFAVYLQDYEDIQKTQSILLDNGTFGTTTLNAAKAEISGLEAEVILSVTENLRVNLSYALVDAKYKEWDLEKLNRGTNELEVLDASDGYFTYVPENTLTFGASYTLPLDPALGEISVMGSVYWQDKMKTFATPQLLAWQADAEGWSDADLQTAYSTVDVDSYHVVNLRVDWRNVMGSEFDVAAWANNVTDEHYIVGGLNVIDSLGWTSDVYGAPRTAGVSVRYSF